MSFEPSWKLSLFCLSIVPLQPAFDDRLRRTRRGFAVGAFSAVHLEATHVEPSHVLVTLFRTIRVAGKTRLQGTRCHTVLITFWRAVGIHVPSSWHRCGRGCDKVSMSPTSIQSLYHGHSTTTTRRSPRQMPRKN